VVLPVQHGPRGHDPAITRPVDLDAGGSVFRTPPDWTRKRAPLFEGAMWAPDISFAGGRYLLYCAVSSFGTNQSCIGLATNTTLDPSQPGYSWKDEGQVICSRPGKDNWNAIDPNLAWDDGGHCYLAFGSFWDGIKMAAIDPASGKLLRDPPDLLPLARRPGVPQGPIEAPFRRHGLAGSPHVRRQAGRAPRAAGATHHLDERVARAGASGPGSLSRRGSATACDPHGRLIPARRPTSVWPSQYQVRGTL